MTIAEMSASRSRSLRWFGVAAGLLLLQIVILYAMGRIPICECGYVKLFEPGVNTPDAPHTVLQTLDATTGQNALNQVEIFRNVAGVSGLIMTKLDGTARGGILVAIAAKHKLPVYFIGVGEGVDDLEPFEAEDFAKAIAGV